MWFGYGGKILHVNLTKKAIKYRPITKGWAEKYVGGNGFCTKILYYELPPDTPALSPENMLVFMAGPLTGTHAPMSSRYQVQAKSPLTGLWGQADSGGFWGREMKRAGVDGIVVEGASNQPVYLWVSNDDVEIRAAGDLWGTTTYQAQSAIKHEVDKEAKTVVIGPAGENLVKFATIANDGSRTAGRCGLGAVMGSKKLKAIAVRGQRDVDVANEVKLDELRTEMIEHFKESPSFDALRNHGTSFDSLEWSLDARNLPLKNWIQNDWDPGIAKSIGGIGMREVLSVKGGACYGCPVGCEKNVQVMDGPFHTEVPSKLEYESMAALGPLLLNGDLKAIAKLNDLCNEYGLDTIETGTTMAFVLECYDKRIVSKQDIGIELAWGNGEAMIELLEMICRKKGFGAILSEGVRESAEMIGKGAAEFAMHVKGSSICMHDPRSPFKPGMGLKYAVGNTGAYHGLGDVRASSEEGPYELAKALVEGQNWAEIIESLVMCSFVFEKWALALPYTYISDLISAVTGQEVDEKKLLEIGNRLYNMKHTFNLKLGIGRKDDMLPERFVKIPRILQDGTARTANIEAQLKAYYDIREWT